VIAMPKRKEIKAVSYIYIGNNPAVLFSSLPRKKRNECFAVFSERASRTASEYYSQHLDEFERLCQKSS
jgi:hypothetical protein